MRIESMAVVLHHAPFAGRDKLILLGIANHDGDGGSFPAIATLAKYGNCSPASVKRSLAVLMDAGAIVRHIQGGGNHRTPEWARTNLYEVMVECPSNCDKTRKHKPVDPELPAESMLWIKGGSTLTPGSVVEPRGGSGDERGGGSVVEPLTIKEPPNNLKSQSPSESTSPAAKTKCWACGQLHPGKGSYCNGCTTRGFNTPIINCRHDGCEVTQRRVFPGQQSFECKGH
jgi:hypothetical protein